MATHTGPFTHGGTEDTLGNPYALLDALVRQHLVERFDVLVGGLSVSAGDLAKSGSDTGRFRRATGFGAAKKMTAMTSETQAITAAQIQSFIDSITIGRHGLAYEETFTRAVLDNDGLDVDSLAATIADSWFATLRSLVVAQAQAFATNTADAAATPDVDDVIATRNAFEETPGFEGQTVNGLLAPRQITQIRASMRNETALKFPEPFVTMQGLQVNSGKRFDFLGMGFYATNDIVVSGGKYTGGFWVPGAIAHVVGGTQDMGDLSDASPMFIPEYGLVITKKTDGDLATKRRTANAFLGCGTLSANLFPQFLFQSLSA